MFDTKYVFAVFSSRWFLVVQAVGYFCSNIGFRFQCFLELDLSGHAMKRTSSWAYVFHRCWNTGTHLKYIMNVQITIICIFTYRFSVILNISSMTMVFWMHTMYIYVPKPHFSGYYDKYFLMHYSMGWILPTDTPIYRMKVVGSVVMWVALFEAVVFVPTFLMIYPYTRGIILLSISSLFLNIQRETM